MPVGEHRTQYTRRSGTWLAYQVSGEGEHDLLLMTDWSLPLDFRWEAEVVSRALTRLGTFCRVISFDKRGVGCSERVPITDSATAEAWVEDAITILDEVGVEKAAIFANGDGASIAMLLAAMHPDRVRSLILHNATAKWLRSPDWPSGLPLEVFEAMTHDDDRLQSDLEDGGSLFRYRAPSLAGDERIRRQFAAWRRIQGGPSVVGPLSRTTVQLDLRSILPLISAPTLMVHAKDNRMVRAENARATSALLPGSRLVELPTSDHVFWGLDQDLVLDEVEAFLTGAPPARRPDRILLTVLFADIVSSTERAAAAGDEAWRRTITLFEGLARHHLERHRGSYVKSTGDGLLATFDGPARAARFGADLVRAADTALNLRCRVGIHTGEVEALEADVAGIGVHIASRACDRAEAQQVVVTRTVRDLATGSGIEFSSLGHHELRGISEPWELFEVSG